LYGSCCSGCSELDMLKYIVGALSLVLLAYIVLHCERHLLVVLVYDWLMNGTCLRLHYNEVLAHGLM